jgi:hypothetical protein
MPMTLNAKGRLSFHEKHPADSQYPYSRALISALVEWSMALGGRWIDSIENPVIIAPIDRV